VQAAGVVVFGKVRGAGSRSCGVWEGARCRQQDTGDNYTFRNFVTCRLFFSMLLGYLKQRSLMEPDMER
jgi:hypothetical protein